MEFLSPEMVDGISYGPEVDVWSLGVLTYDLILESCYPCTVSVCHEFGSTVFG